VYVNEEQLSRVPIMKKPLELTKMVERVLGKMKAVRILGGAYYNLETFSVKPFVSLPGS
jgi:hypothetical protein